MTHHEGGSVIGLSLLILLAGRQEKTSFLPQSIVELELQGYSRVEFARLSRALELWNCDSR